MMNPFEALFRGWPKCAREGCAWPAIFRFETKDESGLVTAHLCIMCVGSAPELLRTMVAVRKEQRLLQGTNGNGQQAIGHDPS